MLRRSLAIFGLLFFLDGCATTGGQTEYWDGFDLAQHQTSSVMLRSRTGEIVWTAQTAQVQLIHDVKVRIERAARTSARFMISHDKEPNAYAGYIGGRLSVGMTSGMVELLGNDRDAFAAVLGHEFAHIRLRHSETREERRAPMQAASLILGTVLAVAGVPMGGTIADVGTTMLETSYSRDEEREADATGLDYVVQAGYNPHGAIRLWEHMQAKASGFAIPFLNTHPMSEERIGNMREIVAKLGASATPGGAENQSVSEITAAEPSADPALVAVGKTVYVTYEPMAIQRAPTLVAEPVERIYMHSILIVEEVRGEWVRVQSNSNMIGWIPISAVRLVVD